jgi:hypothetical protein
MENWFAQFLKAKQIEDMMAVVVEYPQVILLVKVTGDNVVMMLVLLFGHLQRNVESDELLDPLCGQLFHQRGPSRFMRSG